MNKYLVAFVLASLFGLSSFAQTCATAFAAGTVAFSETCTQTGADAYTIVVTATSDSALQIQGLWREVQLLAADVDCNAQTFSIPRLIRSPLSQMNLL